MDITDLLDLDTWPLHAPGSPAWEAIVAHARAELAARGMVNLHGFLRPAARAAALAETAPKLAAEAYTHRRQHNIYFRREVPGLAPGHPALRELETVSHTLCADQLRGGVLEALYRWPPFAAFLAAAMQKPVLHCMADPLAALNVMGYGAGEALNWHFDRSEFTTTLLLQAPEAGGLFEYRTDLRSAADPNHAGVARLLAGEDPAVQRLALEAGTLNIFRGRDTAHRVTPVEGARQRIVAVFAFFETPGVMFTAEERTGFYGRAA